MQSLACVAKHALKRFGKVTPNVMMSPMQVTRGYGFSAERLSTDLSFSDKTQGLPLYHVMDGEGRVVLPEADPNLPKETCVRMYTLMLHLSAMDNIFYEAQRQGRRGVLNNVVSYCRWDSSLWMCMDVL